MPSGDPDQGEGGALRVSSALLPVADRVDADAEGLREERVWLRPTNARKTNQVRM